MGDHIFNVVFFGEELSLAYPYLLAIQRHKGRSVLIDSFLDDSCSVLRHELRRQSKSNTKQEYIPTYQSIFDLAEGLQRENIRNPALDCALLCIAQIAGFMRFAFILEHSSIRYSC